ncbi:MAG TPA: YegS/Rv2252/BmrU family lipid kinase [Candidatus Choladousia intestinigallinarum]|nr:YegS/Rv2252/BmrU family lipid kinase [Candidatus Choladousia intestinigallinarum]
MKKMLFIYNPKSGQGQIRNHLSAILEKLSAGGYDLTVYPTKESMDACRIVCQRAGEFDLIVCSGGDGTLNEVVTGLMQEGITRCVGYIPAGSTNDFANSLGLPRQMDKAAQLIVDGTPFSCDIGKFNEDYFVYVAAFGMFTDVSYQTKQEMKNLFGHAAYVLEGMKRIGNWKSVHLEVESTEYTGSGDFILGLIANSNSVGGFKGLTGKDIEINDGLFEVLLVHTPANLMEWQEAITTVLLQNKSSRLVERFKTQRLTIRSEEPVSWTRDGENGGEWTQVDVENLHQKLNIMVDAFPSQAPREIPAE